MTENKRVIDLTVGELIDAINSRSIPREAPLKPGKRLVYGYQGIRDLFNCGHKKAHELKNGIIKDAVSQQGRLIVVDVDKALELFKQKTA